MQGHRLSQYKLEPWRKVKFYKLFVHANTQMFLKKMCYVVNSTIKEIEVVLDNFFTIVLIK